MSRRLGPSSLARARAALGNAARVVHQDVEAAEDLERGIDQARDVRRLEHVARALDRGAAGLPDLRRHLLERLRAAAGQRELRAFSSEHERDGPAETGARAGHDGHFVLETHVVPLCGGRS
jgi:hypothetical protein